MPEDVTKKLTVKLTVTFATGLPMGTRGSFKHEGQVWLAYPSRKQSRLFALVDRMVGALGRIQVECIAWISGHPEDAARVAMLLQIIAHADAIKREVIEGKVPSRADR